MFGVGMHFSVEDLWAVRSIALPGAIVQIIVATAMGLGLTWLWGWSFGAGLVFGLALSVASTVVLLKALESLNLVDTPDGKIAIGWLIVEDLIMVLTLVLLPAFAGHLGGEAPSRDPSSGTNIWLSLGLTLGKVLVFIGIMLVLGTRLFPWVLRRVERTGSRELFTLAAAALALGVAFGSAKLFGVSFALGAFFAGVVINQSELSHRAAADLQPLQDAFGVLFFVAVGMLFDPKILVRYPLREFAVIGIIIIGKFLAALGIVLALRRPLSTALTVSAALAQIGEFSFILAALGVSLELLPPEAQSLIVAGALLSISLNPLVFFVVSRCFKGISPPRSKS
jgi:CPA2 family monovalent cation:H+ antiporter-2